MRQKAAPSKPSNQTAKKGVLDFTVIQLGKVELSVREQGIRDARRAFERVKDEMRKEIRAES